MLTITYSQVCRKQGPVLCRPSKKILTSSMRHPCLIIRILFLTKTNKTLAVTQGPRPLFLIRLRLAPKQASASRSRRRNSLRSSDLHHSKKNLENRLTQKSKELRLKRDE